MPAFKKRAEDLPQVPELRRASELGNDFGDGERQRGKEHKAMNHGKEQMPEHENSRSKTFD
jgi:hypothetical protein